MLAPVPSAKCRLYVIQARDAPRAVIFRRGPSAQVMLALWHTDSDRVEEGQWLKGRIYERRADLSPDGTKLLYFAAQWRRPVATWTAISTPPWLTALAFWPKGDAWGGGGLWESRDRIVLNHPYGDLKRDPSSRLPSKLQVREMGLFGRGGEDFPLLGMRLARDGWHAVGGARLPLEYARGRPKDPSLALHMHILSVNERGGDWYVVEHRVIRREGRRAEVALDLGRTEWADWDARGDLVYAKGGVLLRRRLQRGVLGEPAVVIDLRDRTFVARPAPPEALVWRTKR